MVRSVNTNKVFCAKDVCDVLGYKRARSAVAQLVNMLDVVKHNAWVVTEEILRATLKEKENLLKKQCLLIE